MYGENEPYSAANPPPKESIGNWGASLTRQSDAQAADINYIMAKYEETGYLPVQNRELFFADVSKVGSFDAAVAVVHNIEEQFSHIPAEVRKRFNNDPAEFLDFTRNPANVDEMKEMGLLRETENIPAQVDIDAAVARVLTSAKARSADSDPGAVVEPAPDSE